MSAPNTPNTDFQPLSFDQAIQYYWTGPNDPTVTEYRLTLNYSGGSLTYTIPAPEVTYLATGLTNGVTYSATLEARNANGYSTPGTYRDWQSGAPPNIPVTATAALVGSNGAFVSWSAGTPVNAQVQWYVIDMYSTSNPLPLASYSANGLTQSNFFISGLSTNAVYYFNVSAVNCPDYSAPKTTSTIQYLYPFTPNMLGGMNMWLDGRDPLATGTAPTNGATVNTWFDKSGSGYNATAAGTGGVPTYSSTEQTVNVFSSNSYYTTTYSASLSNESIFFVFKPTNANQTGMLAPAGPTTIGGRAVYVWTTPLWLEAGLNSIAGYTTTTSNSIVLNTTMLGTVTITNNTWNSFINSGNQRLSSTGTNPTAGRTTNLGYSQYTYELNIFNRGLTPFECQKVEGYLAWKWNIQSNLPSSHPFKSSAPYSNSVFAPPMFSTLRFWYDAQDSDTVVRTGSSVTQWSDKSSNALHMRRVGLSTITYNSSAVNNYPGLYFSSFAGMSTAATVLSPTSQLTYFMVLNQTQPGPAVNSGLFESAAGFQYLFLFTHNGTKNVSLVLNNSAENNTGSNIAGLNTLLGFTTNGVSASASIFVNGNTTNTFTTGSSFPLSVSQPYRLAASAWVGNICEVMAYSNALSTGDRQTVEGYLAWKWGLQGNLPVTHPYILNNPAAVTTTFTVATTSLLLRFDATTYSGTGNWSNTGNLGPTYNATRISGTPTKNAAGNGLVFNGATSTLAYTVPNMTSVSTVFTLSTWVKRLPSFTGFSAIFTQDFVTTNINFMLGPANTTSQVVQAGHFTSGTFYLTNSSTMPLNTWFNYTATFNGTIYRLYENGVATTTYTPGVSPVNNGLQYYIGRLWSASYFTGEVGQLLVYNRALTPAEVLQNYAATSNTFSV